MSMNKKQVKALLDIMSSDESRPTLNTALVDTYEGRTVLVVTDSYQMAVVRVDAPEALLGKMIKREAFVRWYKLASAKDTLDLAEVAEGYLFEGGNYPPYQQLLEAGDREPTAAGVAFNSVYINNMQVLNGQPIVWTFGNKLQPIIGKDNGNLYIVMPLKS